MSEQDDRDGRAEYRPWLFEDSVWQRIDDPIRWSDGEAVDEGLRRAGYDKSVTYGPPDSPHNEWRLVVWAARRATAYSYVCELDVGLCSGEAVYCGGLPDVLELCRMVVPLISTRSNGSAQTASKRTSTTRCAAPDCSSVGAALYYVRLSGGYAAEVPLCPYHEFRMQIGAGQMSFAERHHRCPDCGAAMESTHFDGPCYECVACGGGWDADVMRGLTEERLRAAWAAEQESVAADEEPRYGLAALLG